MSSTYNKIISDAQKAGAIQPSSLIFGQSFQNSSSLFPQDQFVQQDLSNDGSVWDSDPDIEDLQKFKSPKSLFTNSGLPQPNSTYNMTPGYFGNTKSIANSSSSGIFNNSNKKTPLFNMSSGFGNSFSDMNYGPTSYSGHVFGIDSSNSSLFKNQVKKDTQIYGHTAYPNNQNQTLSGQSSTFLFCNNKSSIINTLFNNQKGEEIFVPNSNSPSTVNDAQQKTKSKEQNIFEQQKKIPVNMFMIPNSKKVAQNSNINSLPLHSLPLKVEIKNQTHQKIFLQNKPINTLNINTNLFKLAKQLDSNQAKKQYQKLAINNIHNIQVTNIFDNNLQNQSKPIKQAKSEQHSVESSSLNSNSSQQLKKQQTFPPDNEGVNQNDSPLLIDLNEQPQSTETVFIIPSEQSQPAKVYELKETRKIESKQKISKESQETNQTHKLRVRVSELEQLNKSYLRVIQDLSETVKNLSMGMAQKIKPKINQDQKI